MTDLERRVRAAVYRSFVDTSRAPDVRALSAATLAPPSDVEAALAALARLHAIVLRPGSTAIWMAHPFAADETAFRVVAGGRTYYANCAWDAAGVLSLIGDGDCTTPCGECGDLLRFKVSAGTVRGSGVAHFVVPARRFWDDIAFT